MINFLSLDIMHRQSPRMTVFSETPMEKKFQSKSMLVNVEFTKIRKGSFTGEIVIAEEIYQYRYPYYLPESILFLPTYNDYYRNYMVKIKLLFIESYSSSAVEKRMRIKAFLSQFHRSNQKIAKIKKEILGGLDKMNSGKLLPRNQKNFKGFKTLKELKFTKTRMLVQPGINGSPDQIVAIFMRRDMDNIASNFKGKYK